jgi:hypothetical protein
MTIIACRLLYAVVLLINEVDLLATLAGIDGE